MAPSCQCFCVSQGARVPRPPLPSWPGFAFFTFGGREPWGAFGRAARLTAVFLAGAGPFLPTPPPSPLPPFTRTIINCGPETGKNHQRAPENLLTISTGGIGGKKHGDWSQTLCWAVPICLTKGLRAEGFGRSGLRGAWVDVGFLTDTCCFRWAAARVRRVHSLKKNRRGRDGGKGGGSILCKSSKREMGVDETVNRSGVVRSDGSELHFGFEPHRPRFQIRSHQECIGGEGRKGVRRGLTLVPRFSLPTPGDLVGFIPRPLGALARFGLGAGVSTVPRPLI